MIAIALWLLGFVSGLFTLIALACAKVSGDCYRIEEGFIN